MSSAALRNRTSRRYALKLVSPPRRTRAAPAGASWRAPARRRPPSAAGGNGAKRSRSSPVEPRRGRRPCTPNGPPAGDARMSARSAHLSHSDAPRQAGHCRATSGCRAGRARRNKHAAETSRPPRGALSAWLSGRRRSGCIAVERERLRPADQRHGPQAPPPRGGRARQPGAAQPGTPRTAVRTEPAHFRRTRGRWRSPAARASHTATSPGACCDSPSCCARGRRWRVGENLAWGIAEASTREASSRAGWHPPSTATTSSVAGPTARSGRSPTHRGPACSTTASPSCSTSAGATERRYRQTTRRPGVRVPNSS
jgi:hypothetical protein